MKKLEIRYTKNKKLNICINFGICVALCLLIIGICKNSSALSDILPFRFRPMWYFKETEATIIGGNNKDDFLTETQSYYLEYEYTVNDKTYTGKEYYDSSSWLYSKVWQTDSDLEDAVYKVTHPYFYVYKQDELQEGYDKIIIKYNPIFPSHSYIKDNGYYKPFGYVILVIFNGLLIFCILQMISLIKELKKWYKEYSKYDVFK